MKIRQGWILALACVVSMVMVDTGIAGDSVGTPSDSVYSPPSVPDLLISSRSQRGMMWMGMEGQTRDLRVNFGGGTRIGARLRVLAGRPILYDSSNEDWGSSKTSVFKDADADQTDVSIYEIFCLRHRTWEPWLWLRGDSSNMTAAINPIADEILTPAVVLYDRHPHFGPTR